MHNDNKRVYTTSAQTALGERCSSVELCCIVVREGRGGPAGGGLGTVLYHLTLSNTQLRCLKQPNIAYECWTIMQSCSKTARRLCIFYFLWKSKLCSLSIVWTYPPRSSHDNSEHSLHLFSINLLYTVFSILFSLEHQAYLRVTLKQFMNGSLSMVQQLVPVLSVELEIKYSLNDSMYKRCKAVQLLSDIC